MRESLELLPVIQPPIPTAPLYYRNLQASLCEALQDDRSYFSVAMLTDKAREDLEW